MHQGIPASVFIYRVSEKVLALAQVTYEGNASKEGGVITALKTWLKAMSLAIDIARQYPCWTTDDDIYISKTLDNLKKAKEYLERKIESRLNESESWIRKRVQYAIRDIKWLINKVSDIKVTPINERVKAMCLEISWKE